MNQAAEPYPSPDGPPSQIPPQAKTSAMAVWSLVTSLLCVPLVPIILGLIAISKVSQSGGRLKGGGFAIAGLVIGFLGFGWLALSALAAPAILRARRSADLAEATNNLRNLGIFMFAYENEFGTFPSESIYTNMPARFRNGSGGGSANDLLGQFIAGGFTVSEEVFYAKGGASIDKRPDGVFDSPNTLLERGECGFGYVMINGNEAMTTRDNGGRPLLVAPLAPGSGGADPTFNSKPYNGRAVYLRIDQSVKQNRIDEKSGKVLLPGKRTLFETGEDTVWGGDIPHVRAPE